MDLNIRQQYEAMIPLLIESLKCSDFMKLKKVSLITIKIYNDRHFLLLTIF